PPASATATEIVAATRATTANDAIRFSFEFEGTMMHFTAGTPLPGPSQNSRWRSDLFGALRRRTKTNPKNSGMKKIIARKMCPLTRSEEHTSELQSHSDL